MTGLGGHQTPWLASVAPTLASSSELVGATPSVNDAWFCAVTVSAIDGCPGPGDSASDRIPSRTAMSTTGAIPVVSSSLTKAVFGDCARASCRVICGG